MRNSPQIMWQNLYLYSDNQINHSQVQQSLQAALLEDGYTLYDPFAVIPGRAFAQQIRLFIAPETAGWIRILGDAAERFLPRLSGQGFVMLCILEDNTAQIMTWQGGAALDPLEGLAHHLSDKCSAGMLDRALSDLHKPERLVRQDDDPLPLDALPDEIQQLASGLGKWRKKLLFNQLMKRVNKYVSGDPDAAMALLKSQEPDWSSTGGQRLEAVMRCLTIPANWRKPDFTTLRDAYQLHLRRQRYPNAPSLPGDQATMDAVPDALDYTPVYAGKA